MDQTTSELPGMEISRLATPQLPTQRPMLIPMIPTHKQTNPFEFGSPTHPINPPPKKPLFDFSSLGLSPTPTSKKVQQARQLLIEAAAELSDKKEEQSRILDLLEVFQKYTEQKDFLSPTKVLAQQASKLERAAKKFTNLPQKNPLPKTYADAIQEKPSSQMHATREKEREWTLVGTKKPAKTQAPTSLRLVLSLKDKSIDLPPIQTRDKINQTFKELGRKSVGVISASKSLKGNLVVFCLDRDALVTLEKSTEKFFPVLGECKVLESSTWHKVVVFGVSNQDFKGQNGLSRARYEIETFNRGLKLVSDPIWITSEEQRATQLGGTLIVAFQSEIEANRAIQERLYVGGVSCRAVKAVDKTREKTTPTPC